MDRLRRKTRLALIGFPIKRNYLYHYRDFFTQRAHETLHQNSLKPIYIKLDVPSSSCAWEIVSGNLNACELWNENYMLPHDLLYLILGF